MAKFTEANLEFEFATALEWEKFDDATTYLLSHCGMKSVDFIVELPEQIIFLEVKDPQHPHATLTAKTQFVRELRSGELIENVLRPKCLNSLLYKLATQDINLDKPIYYYVLIAIDTLREPELSEQNARLRRKLPLVPRGGKLRKKFKLQGKKSPQFIEGCMIFNIATWNRTLGPPLKTSVRRRPQN